ncbi:hypothetical protein [Paenibacillus chitinolyticus]
MTLSKNKNVLVTADQELTLCFYVPLDYAVPFLAGFGFDKIHAGHIANMKKIKYYDPVLMLAHFDNNIHAHVSRANKHKVKHLPRKSPTD